MGIFDSYFNPQGFKGMSGLLDHLPMWQMQQGASTGFPGDNGSLPNNAQPMAGPPLNIVPQAPAAPQEVGMGDRLMAGFQGFARGGGGLLPAIAGAVEGARTGQTPQNMTVQALTQRGMDENTARAVASDPGLLRSVLPNLLGIGKQTEDITNFEYARKYEPTLTWQQYQQRKRAGAGEYGLQPIWGTVNGKPAAAQLGKGGAAALAQMPEGFEIANKPIEVQTATATILIDPQSRQVISAVPKNVAEGKRQEKVGTEQGAAEADLASIESKMPGLEMVVRKLDDLSNKATYTVGGQLIDAAMRQTGQEPRESAIARAEYVSMVDNQILPLLRDTFGAQFTQKEGQTLRETLGDPDKSPKEKQAVLRSFIEQKRRDVEAMKVRTGKAEPPDMQATPTAPTKVRKYNPATGRIE